MGRMEKVIAPAKIAMYEKTQRMFNSYDNYMFMDLSKVLSTQFKNIKSELPKDVKFLFAKNKIMIKALQEINKNGKYDKTIEQIKNNIIVAFYEEKSSAEKIYQVCNKYRRNAHARFGDVANEDVIIPAGPTGLPPTKINVFHAAHMNTVIVKGKIEIAVEHKLVGSGEIVGISEANLLSLLKIFESGEVFDKSVLAVTDEIVQDSIKEAISLIACVSLGTGMLTEASLPYEIMEAKNDLKKV